MVQLQFHEGSNDPGGQHGRAPRALGKKDIFIATQHNGLNRTN